MRRQRREIFREGLYIAVKNRISGKWRVPVRSPESFSMSKKFPTLRDLFFDFAMTDKVGFTNTGEFLSNSQGCLSRLRRSRQIKKRLNLVRVMRRKKISGRCCRYLQIANDHINLTCHSSRLPSATSISFQFNGDPSLERNTLYRVFSFFFSPFTSISPDRMARCRKSVGSTNGWLRASYMMSHFPVDTTTLNAVNRGSSPHFACPCT